MEKSPETVVCDRVNRKMVVVIGDLNPIAEIRETHRTGTRNSTQCVCMFEEEILKVCGALLEPVGGSFNGDLEKRAREAAKAAVEALEAIKAGNMPLWMEKTRDSLQAAMRVRMMALEMEAGKQQIDAAVGAGA
jgi:hypothetical protein